jgi:chromosome segregation ATPase
MKHSNLLFIIFLMFIAASCGSTEKVITDAGAVYEVKGNTFYKNGEDVTETLTDDKKEAIKSELEERLEAEEEALKQKEDLEDVVKEAEKTKEEAIEKQEAIESALERKEKARQAFFKAKDKLQKAKEKYERFHKKGKLSPNEEEEWAKKIEGLEEDVQSAQKELDKQ